MNVCEGCAGTGGGLQWTLSFGKTHVTCPACKGTGTQEDKKEATK